ncbi:MAG: hypothetical protein ACRDD8_14185 [Bacteroidales bacterium]
MKEIRYVYHIYEGVGPDNIEQDLYGAVKKAPVAVGAAVGALAMFGYSRISRMLAYQKAKKLTNVYADDFLDDIVEWHELNDSKMENVCNAAATNYKAEIKRLSVEFAKLQKANADIDIEKAQYEALEKLKQHLNTKLKQQLDSYIDGINGWAVGLLQSYTDKLFAGIVDEKMSKKIQNSVYFNTLNKTFKKESKNFVSESIGDNLSLKFTKLSKKQTAELTSLWLKQIMRINSEGGDITKQSLDAMKSKYFSDKKSGLSSFSSIFDLDTPQGFMTSSNLNELRAYMQDVVENINYIDRKFAETVQANVEDKKGGDTPNNPPAPSKPQPKPQDNINPDVLETVSYDYFKSKLLEHYNLTKNK